MGAEAVNLGRGSWHEVGGRRGQSARNGLDTRPLGLSPFIVLTPALSTSGRSPLPIVAFLSSSSLRVKLQRASASCSDVCEEARLVLYTSFGSVWDSSLRAGSDEELSRRPTKQTDPATAVSGTSGVARGKARYALTPGQYVDCLLSPWRGSMTVPVNAHIKP